MSFQVVHILLIAFQKINDIIVKGETIQFLMPYRLRFMRVHLLNVPS